MRFPFFNNKWSTTTLGTITKVFSGGTPSSKNKAYYNGNIPFIRSGEINKEETELFLSEDGLKNSSAKLVSKGDLLLALYGATSGEIGISKIDGAINQAILCIKSNENIGFLKYLWESHVDGILKTYLQGGQGNLSAEIFKSIKIHIPSLEEQLVLYDFFEKLEKRINTQKKIIEDLLSSKNIIKNKMIHKAKEIGNYYTLKELGQYFNGVAHENNISEQGYVLINSKFISSDGTIKKHVNDSSFVLKKNDICIVLSDLPNGKALSKCFFVNKDNYYALNQRIACIRTNDISFSKYLYYYLSRNDYFLKFDDGVSQTNLKKDDVLNCPIYYSDFVKKYIEYLEIIDIKIKNEKQILLLYEQQKQYLLDKMFI